MRGLLFSFTAVSSTALAGRASTTLLKKDGYDVSVVQNPTLSLDGDAAATKRVIDAQSEPVILVGHSYGGAVITEAGNDPNVAALVYIAAFAPDKGESVNTLIEGPPQDATAPPILPPQDGFLFLDQAKFHASFAADVDAEKAAFMADSQVPWGVGALGGTISEAGVERQAELVSGHHRGPDDPAAGPAQCPARGRNRRGGRGQPLGLRVAAGSRGGTRQEGGFRSEVGRGLVRAGSYRIATAPEPNSSRLTSFKSTRFDNPANNVGPWPTSLGCTTNSY